MSTFLLDVLAIWLGTSLAMIGVGALALWGILRWIEGDEWAERSDHPVDESR